MGERKPEVPAAVGDAITARAGEFRDAIARRDFAAAQIAAREAWDAIPDPKTQWEYYPDVLPRSYADVFVRAGAVEHALAWLKIAMGSEPATVGENVTLDRVAARVWAAAGEHETAERIAGTLLNLYGTRPFSDDDSDLLPLARAYAARTGASPTATASSGEAGFPRADGGAAHERGDLDDEIERLAEAGSQAMDDEDWRGAVEHWTQALRIIPAPRSEWTAATWFYTCLGDAYYVGGDLDSALVSLGEGLKCPDAFASSFLWLRHGQVLADLGDTAAAVQSLTSAYMLEGSEIFDGEDPRYLDLLAEHIDLEPS